jgi:hypothetical protein
MFALATANKMKNKKYHTVGAVPKFNRKMAASVTIDTFSTQIQDNSLSWFDTGNSIKKSGVVKLVL